MGVYSGLEGIIKGLSSSSWLVKLLQNAQRSQHVVARTQVLHFLDNNSSHWSRLPRSVCILIASLTGSCVLNSFSSTFILYSLFFGGEISEKSYPYRREIFKDFRSIFAQLFKQIFRLGWRGSKPPVCTQWMDFDFHFSISLQRWPLACQIFIKNFDGALEGAVSTKSSRKAPNKGVFRFPGTTATPFLCKGKSCL